MNYDSLDTHSPLTNSLHHNHDAQDDSSEIIPRAEVLAVFGEARKCQTNIAKLTVKERLSYVARLRHEIIKTRDSLVESICAETGKTPTDAIASEIFGILDTLSFLEKHGQKALADETVPTPLPLMGKASKIYYESLGTVLVIAPWNYPLFQTIVPAMFSFVAGNATVLKPSEITPLKGVIEKLLAAAQFPHHSIQILYGDGVMAQEAIAARPDYISFTGGVPTGRKVMAQASQFLIPVELELGGKDVALVFDDVNLHRTVRGLVFGAFTNGGQSCSSIERILIQESIFDKTLSLMLEETAKLTHGNKDTFSNDLGQMTRLAQAQKVHELVQDAKAKGATIACGGEWSPTSFFYPPTILTGVTQEMSIATEEIFGPVVVVGSFADESQAIRLANQSPFGLSASVWTKDLKRADRVSRLLDVGAVSINNVMLTEGNAALPFGGTKLSGIGRIKGVQGLRALARVKSIIVDKQSNKIEGNWYPFTPRKYQLFSGLIGYFAGGLKGLVAFVRNGLQLESHSQKPRS